MKKEKKKTELAMFALASSGNSSSTLEECGETSERPLKKRKQNSQEAPLKNGMEDSSVSFSKSKKKKCFSKRELVSSDLEETAGSGGASKRNKSFPKVEPVGDSQETGESPRKRGHALPRRSHSAVDLKSLLPARAVDPRRRNSSKSYSRKIRMDKLLVGVACRDVS